MTGAAQIRNADLVDILRTDFQHRNEPNFAWKSAASVLQVIPGVIAAWPMSIVRLDNASSRARDATGAGYDLTSNNNVLFGYEPSTLIPYAVFNGVDRFLSRVDGGPANWADVRGTETHIPVAQRGLTLGGWFWFDNTAAAIEHCIGKRIGIGNLSYYLRRLATGEANFEISDDGTNTDNATSVVTIPEDSWHCMIGRFDPSTSVDVFLDGTWATGATARASIFDSGADFTIGAVSGGGEYMAGRSSLCWLSQMYLSDAIAFNFYQQTRAMFGV